jgi:hypothetical protein
MPKTYIPIAIQRSIIALSKDYCEYCIIPAAFATDFYNFDHITPVSKDGLTELRNLARCCSICNGHKHDKIAYIDPLTQQPCRLYNPRQDKWADHFQWSIDDLRLVGKTAIGHTTIALLQLNRSNTVNLRKLLKMAGLHPPTI